MRISEIQLPLIAAALAFSAHTSAFGATYFWDSDADAAAGSPAASTAGSGTWNAANTNWNLNGSAGSDVAWVTNSDAVFAGSDGTYAITVGSALTVGNLTFNSSGYTLSAASATKLSQFNANTAITVASGKTATIGNNVTYESTFGGGIVSLLGTATPGNSAGTLIIDNGGRVNTTSASSIIYVGSNSNTAGSLRSTVVEVKSGGTLSSASSVVVNGSLNVTGGSVSTGAASGLIAIGNFADANMPSSAILTISSGSVFAAGGVRFGAASGTTNTGGTLNLDGGTLTTTKLYSGGAASSSTVNFNGGTLKATVTNNSDFLNTNINNAVVKAGGAVIDTNGFDVTISKALTHDAGLGGTADGGLTKISSGTLTLSGVNTYTGDTSVTGGTLKLGASGSINNSAVIAVGSSGVFDVSSVSGYSLASGQTLRGAGQVTGAVIAGSGRTVAAGMDASTIGSLTFNSSLNVSLATVSLKLDSASGTFDLISANGLTLGNAVLSLIDIGSGAWLGDSTFTLVNNTSGSGIAGTFLGLDEGSVINVGSNAFTISYAGGTGNDITLSLFTIPEPSAYAALVGALALAGALVTRRRRA